MSDDAPRPEVPDRIRLLRGAIDPVRLMELARRWSAWRAGEVEDVDAAFAAYLSESRCRWYSPNPLFDEGWYVRHHADVKQAIDARRFISGFDHFVQRGVFEGRAYNTYVHRRMGWCSSPAPPLTDVPAGARPLDDESRAFLEHFPHVSPAVHFNGYGRFLGGVPPGGPATEEGSGRKAILVLGMHRSGTSTLSAALEAAGCFCGCDLFHPSPSNPSGFWESAEVVRTDDAILARAGSRWDDVREVALPDAAARAEAVGMIGRLLERRFATSPLVALKDPRMCRLAGLWREAIAAAGISANVVIQIRHPSEVAASLAARDGLAVETSLRLWMRHVLDALRDTRGLPRTIVPYQDLLEDGAGQIERIGAELGIAWPVAAADREARLAGLVDAGLRHQRVFHRSAAPLHSLPGLEALWTLLGQGRAALERHDDVEAIDRAFSVAGGEPPESA